MATGTQRLVWQRGLLFEGEDSRHFRLPISGDPEIDGAKPSDLLPLSLAACLAYDVVVVLKKKRQQLDTLTVVVESEHQDLPFEVTGVIERPAADRALELALKNCPVRASLSPDVEVVTSIAVR